MKIKSWKLMFFYLMIFILAGSQALLLSGCGGGGGGGGSASTASSVSGTVSGGPNPMPGVNIYLYDSDSTQPIASTVTGGSGNYNISFQNPGGSGLLYLVAEGPSANTNVQFFAVIGQAGSVGTNSNINLNEITTAAGIDIAGNNGIVINSNGVITSADAVNIGSFLAGYDSLVNSSGWFQNEASEQNLAVVADAVSYCVNSSGISSPDCTNINGYSPTSLIDLIQLIQSNQDLSAVVEDVYNNAENASKYSYAPVASSLPTTAPQSLLITASLKSIEISPGVSSVAAGFTEQFTATGVFSDGTTLNITNEVVWNSSDASVASISNSVGSSGLVTASNAGTSYVTASMDDINSSSQAALTVTSATLDSIQITAPAYTVAKGFSEQFTATGIFSNGTKENITDEVVWNSSDASVASISNALGSYGLATGLGTGTTQISASFGNTNSSNYSFNVTAAVLTSIGITPAVSGVVVLTTDQFTATGVFSDGSTQDITDEVLWSSSAPSVASISNVSGSKGLAAAGSNAGTADITASLDGITSADYPLPVTEASLTSINITPVSPSIPLGGSEQLTATGVYSNGTTQDITSDVVWSSNNSEISFSSSSPGEAQCIGTTVGMMNITASLDGISSTDSITVTAATLVSVTVSSSVSPQIGEGDTIQFTATGTYSDGSEYNLTNNSNITWNSSNTSVATVNSSGIATATENSGSTNITAVYDDSATNIDVTSNSVPLTVLSNGAASTPVYVSTDNNTILTFDLSQLEAGGSVQPSAPPLWSGNMLSWETMGIAFDGNGNLWIANGSPANTIIEYGSSQIAGFSSDTTEPQEAVIYSIPVTYNGTSYQTIDDPTSIAFDSSGDLWIVNYANSTIVEYSATELSNLAVDPVPVPAAVIIPGNDSISSPMGITFDSSGDLFVSNYGNNDIVEFNASNLANLTSSDPDQELSPSYIINVPNDYGSGTYSTGDKSKYSLYVWPTCIAYHNGEIWFTGLEEWAPGIASSSADTYNGILGYYSVNDFDSTNNNKTIYPDSATEFAGPDYALTFDKSGNLWVNDKADNEVLEVSSSDLSKNNFSVTTTISSSSSSYKVNYGLAFDSTGNMWVSNGEIIEYTSSQIGATGSPSPSVTISPDPSALDSPSSMVLDSSDNLWVSNTDNNTITEFTSTQLSDGGQQNGNITLSSSSNSIDEPMGIAFDSSGDLWVANYGNSTITEFVSTSLSSSGSPSPSVTLSSSGNSIDEPMGIAFDSSGDLWVANYGNSTITEFTSPSSGGSQSASLKLSLVTQSDVSGSSSYGLITYTYTQTSDIYPAYIAFDSNANLWFSGQEEVEDTCTSVAVCPFGSKGYTKTTYNDIFGEYKYNSGSYPSSPTLVFTVPNQESAGYSGSAQYFTGLAFDPYNDLLIANPFISNVLEFGSGTLLGSSGGSILPSSESSGSNLISPLDILIGK